MYIISSFVESKFTTRLKVFAYLITIGYPEGHVSGEIELIVSNKKKSRLADRAKLNNAL